MQPGCRHYWCHSEALQQVCGTVYSQGSIAVPCREHTDMECQAHTDPLPSHLQSNQTSASRLQVSEQNDWGSSRRKSREGSTNPARHSHAELQSSGCCSRGWPSTRHSWDCCWAQNNDFTLSMPHPQSTTVCATQRLIHAPAGFVGCYSLVLCMERHSIRKSFHTDAGSLILPLGRERTEWYVGVYPVQAEQAGPRYRLVCWHGSSCRHCRAPLRLGTSGSSSTNHGTERGCFRSSTCRSLGPPHNLLQMPSTGRFLTKALAAIIISQVH